VDQRLIDPVEARRRWVALELGKPARFGGRGDRGGGTLVLGLPGNPVAAIRGRRRPSRPGPDLPGFYHPAPMRQRIPATCARIADSNAFNYTIFGVILAVTP